MDYNPNGIWVSKQKPTPSYGDPVAQKPIEPIGKEVDPPELHKRGWLVWLSVGISAVLVLGGVFYYLSIPKPKPSVSVSFSPTSKILVGDPFPISVTVSNLSVFSLKGATLDVQLPSNIAIVGQPSDQHSIQWSLGDMASDTTISQDLTLMASGGSQSVALLGAKVVYATSLVPSVQLEADGSSSVALGGPAVSFAVSVPSNAVSGSDVSLSLSYSNNTSHPLNSTQLLLTYPPAFTFSSSSVPAVSGNDRWDITGLPEGASGTIMVSGVLTSDSSGTYDFAGSMNFASGSESYSIPGPTAGVVLSEPPLGITIVPNGSTGYISKPNDFISYLVTYTNHAPVSLRGVTVTAKLVGAMFDFSSLSTDGSFNSLNDTITWSPSAVPAFALLGPGQSGSFTFQIRTLPNFPIKSSRDSDFSLGVDASISSPTILPGVVATSTTSLAALATKVAGSVAIASHGYRYDTVSGVSNAGPYPPVENQTTTYTIHWIVSDTADPLQNITVSSTLPAGVTFTGNVTSNISSTPQYDPRSDVVTWQIPSMVSGAGVIATSTQAVFQIAETPGVNQVGELLSLLGGTTLQASDIFTGGTLTASANPVTSQLSADPVASKVRNSIVQAQ